MMNERKNKGIPHLQSYFIPERNNFSILITLYTQTVFRLFVYKQISRYCNYASFFVFMYIVSFFTFFFFYTIFFKIIFKVIQKFC